MSQEEKMHILQLIHPKKGELSVVADLSRIGKKTIVKLILEKNVKDKVNTTLISYEDQRKIGYEQETLTEYLEDLMRSDEKTIEFLIIDSIDLISEFEEFMEINKRIKQLKEVARTLNIPVLVTSEKKISHLMKDQNDIPIFTACYVKM